MMRITGQCGHTGMTIALRSFNRSLAWSSSAWSEGIIRITGHLQLILLHGNPTWTVVSCSSNIKTRYKSGVYYLQVSWRSQYFTTSLGIHCAPDKNKFYHNNLMWFPIQSDCYDLLEITRMNNDHLCMPSLKFVCSVRKGDVLLAHNTASFESGSVVVCNTDAPNVGKLESIEFRLDTCGDFTYLPVIVNKIPAATNRSIYMTSTWKYN